MTGECGNSVPSGWGICWICVDGQPQSPADGAHGWRSRADDQIGTGIGVSCSVNSTAMVLHGEVRQDLPTLNADVKDLGERVTRVDILIEGGGRPQAGSGGEPTVTPPPGTDDSPLRPIIGGYVNKRTRPNPGVPARPRRAAERVISPPSLVARQPSMCSVPSPSTRHSSLPCGSGRQVVRFWAESRDNGRARA